jgi:hypothetical protein
MMRQWMCFNMLCLASSVSMACAPLPPADWENSPSRVKANFDAAGFVVSARVIAVKRVMLATDPESDAKTEVERASFRVEHAFKGKLKPGDTFDIESGHSSCARGVLHPQWKASADGKKSLSLPDHPTRWLIYYPPPPMQPMPIPHPPAFEITSSPTSRPLDQASYDIDVLRRHARSWAGAR